MRFPCGKKTEVCKGDKIRMQVRDAKKIGSIICKGQPDEGKITVYCPKNHER